jgi:mannosyltransferase OCH1-like enzyme
MIDKVIHLIWLQGFDKLPDRFNDILNNNKNVLYDYEFKYWDDNSIRDLLTTHYKRLYDIYDCCDIYQGKSDIARYCIIHNYGGIYVDVDFKFYKKIDIFLNKNFICIGFNKFKIINGFFASIKNHIILENIINDLSENKQIINTFNICFITGTIMFKKYIINYKLNSNKINKILILPKHYFHPIYKGNAYNTLYSKYIYTQEVQFDCKENRWFNILQEQYYSISTNINKIKESIEIEKNNKKNDFVSEITIKKYTHDTSIILLVAHPDDELLFFKDILEKYNKYIKVICITNASNKIRSNEFIHSLKRFNILNYEIWDYEDTHSSYVSHRLRKKIKESIKEYTKIYTRSLSGETEHPQHIALYKTVHDEINNNQKLYVPNIDIYSNNIDIKTSKILYSEYKSQTSAKLINILKSCNISHIRIL